METISMEKWGKDHWSLLAYVECRVVDNKGILDPRHLSCSKNYHFSNSQRHWIHFVRIMEEITSLLKVSKDGIVNISMNKTFNRNLFEEYYDGKFYFNSEIEEMKKIEKLHNEAQKYVKLKDVITRLAKEIENEED